MRLNKILITLLLVLTLSGCEQDNFCVIEEYRERCAKSVEAAKRVDSSYQTYYGCCKNAKAYEVFKNQEVNNAYLILKDEDKRSRYDKGESPDDILKSKQNIAQELIKVLFFEIVSSSDVDCTNIVALMKESIEDKITTLETTKKDYLKSIKKFEKVIKKMKSKKKNKMFEALSKGKIDFLEGNVKLADKDKDSLLEALEFLKDFSYDVEAGFFSEGEIDIGMRNGDRFFHKRSNGSWAE